MEDSKDATASNDEEKSMQEDDEHMQEVGRHPPPKKRETRCQGYPQNLEYLHVGHPTTRI